jgi:hypothetical protein
MNNRPALLITIVNTYNDAKTLPQCIDKVA